ncbi:MAG: serine/threonine protein kinase, partial [Myxococcales bacterium]
DLLRPLGRGSIAEVWLARLPGDPGRPVALKRALPHLRATPAIAGALRTEADVLAAVASPHVVRLVARGEEADGPWLALEYIEGVSLAGLLDVQARGGPGLPASAVQRVGLDLLAGLEAIHEAGFLHGDVTPGNLLVGTDGAARLIDLNLAAPVGAPSTGPWRGTAAYTAPERWEPGPHRVASEVFAAAVALWEALRGERLFRAEGVLATRQRILDGDAPRVDHRRPELTPWADVLAAALAPDPRDRPASTRALRDAWSRGPTAEPREAMARRIAAVRRGPSG